MQFNLVDYSSHLMTQFLDGFFLYLPRIIGGLLVFLFGILLAKAMRAILRRLLRSLSFSQAINKTPLQLAMEGQDIGKMFEQAIVTGVFWLIILFVIHTTASIWGITSVSSVVEKILNYLPKIASSLLVFIFGLIMAGLVESLIKSALRTTSVHTARLSARIASYFIVSITSLSALSELGIAREFIMVLFVGFVSALALGLGLAFGLGSKDLVGKVLGKWYEKQSKE